MKDIQEGVKSEILAELNHYNSNLNSLSFSRA